MSKGEHFIKETLLGSESDFGLKQRLFHLVMCLGTFFIGLVFFFGLFFLRNPIYLSIASGAFVVHFLAYAISRFKGPLRVAALLYGIGGYGLLLYAFVHSGGFSGAINYAFLVLFLTLAVVTSPRFRWILFSLLLLTILAMTATAYGWSEAIDETMFAGYYDYRPLYMILIYLSVIILLSGASIFLMNNYDAKAAALKKEIAQKEKRAAQLDQKNRSLQETNEQKNRLFSIIGHDLRHPMASIESFLREIKQEDLDQESRRYLIEELLKLTENSRHLLDNLLRWAHRDNSRPQLGATGAREIANTVIQTMAPVAREKDISIENLIEQEACVWADPTMLEMILRNLLTNAIKFSHAGAAIKMRSYQLLEYLRLEVEDHGLGMSPEQTAALFSEQPPVRNGTKHEKGLGLGMRLCKDFTEKMGSELEVKSQEGKGTTVSVLLPLQEAVGNKEKLLWKSQ